MKSFGADIRAHFRGGTMARGGKTDQVGDRAAADQEPHAAVSGVAEQLHQPTDGSPLDIDSGMVAAGATRVQRGRKKITDDADRCWRRIDPAEEARMAIAHGMRQHLGRDRLDERLGRASCPRPILIEERLALARRHRREHRPGCHAREIVGDEVDRLVAEAAKLFDIHRRRCRHDVSPSPARMTLASPVQ